jgi:hypothetical protein
VEQAPAPAGGDAALRAGALTHLATDAAFHKTPAFAAAQGAAGDLLARAAFQGIRVRRFFLAHVLAELALDAALLRAEPSLADEFYDAFARADRAAMARWAEGAVGAPLPALPGVLTRFARSRYDAGVAEGLSRLCARARQDTFEGANFARLVSVVGQAVAALAPQAPALLSETAAGISPPG